MTTFSVLGAAPAGKTKFANLAELYAYLVETQSVTEVGEVAAVPQHLKAAHKRSLGLAESAWHNLA